ncbi:MAG: right-handed parallel beta-helix repeat-containing protein [Candidatus Roizmanbacteria bacterium]
MSTTTRITPSPQQSLQSLVDHAVAVGAQRIELDGTFTSHGQKQFGLLMITKDLEIIGLQGATLDGEHNVAHVLFVADGIRLTIRDIGFTNGDTQVVTTSLNETNRPHSRLNIFRYLDGGGISMGVGSEVLIERCTFTGNHSAICGGAISNAGGYLRVHTSIFADNSCGDTGAAIDNLAAGSLAMIHDCTFVDNHPNQLGDGMYGAVSAFPHTFLIVKNSDFSKQGGTAIDYRDSTRVHIDSDTTYREGALSPITKDPLPNPKTKWHILSSWIWIFFSHPWDLKCEKIPTCSPGVLEKHRMIYEQAVEPRQRSHR